MRAETGPLGTVELSYHAGRYIRRIIWVSAREMRARPPTAPLGLIYTLAHKAYDPHNNRCNTSGLRYEPIRAVRHKNRLNFGKNCLKFA